MLFRSSFKLFGGVGLMLAFVIAQGLYLGRHLEDTAKPTGDAR